MIAENKMKKWLVLLFCVLTAAGLLVQGAMAAYPTGKCTNMVNEGIEFRSDASLKGDDANDWREYLTVTSELPDGSDAGDVLAMEVTVANSNTRYQCTEVVNGQPNEFSCNSMPANSIITGVYLMFQPDTSVVTEDSKVHFVVTQTVGGKVLLDTSGKVEYPPYPCARNEQKKDFVASPGESAVINTSSDCAGENDAFNFDEQESQYALVNIVPGDTIKGDRIVLKIDPQPQFEYELFLEFEGPASQGYPTYDVVCHHNEDAEDCTITTNELDGLTQDDLPITLKWGNLSSFSTSKTDLGGNPDFPTSFDFDIFFWYENTAGTLGYENSIFHFEREITVQFAPYCTDVTSNVLTVVADKLYDPCGPKQQDFWVDLFDENGVGMVIPETQTECAALAYCNDIYSVTVIDAALSPIPSKNTDYRFVTRKCMDASCTYEQTTTAYPYSITIANGDLLSLGVKAKSNKSGSTTVFPMKVYKNSAKGHEFAVTGARLITEGPGTYVVYGFLEDADIKNNDLSKYAVKFYVTVNEKKELKNCSTLANNGYFKGYWNDCLSHAESQLIPFEHIPGTEEAWIENRSSQGIHFPYVAEYSIMPQKLQITSLRCTFRALSGGGKPKEGYCRPDDVYVPPYTKVTINGGNFLLEAKPTADEYRAAYMRMETKNISHLIFDVTVRSCDNVKKIPNTGISLRSPLKTPAKVDEATSYVFTGNSLRIPAIGLGMETPVPIVHVYYEEGSSELGWDLSTLGNYVGELEGGSYLPYAGNSALTGHFYSQGVFKNLEYLNMGDEIIIFGNDGIKYTYKVVQKFLAQPTDVYEMFQQVGERSLTLVTCENYNLNTDEYERRQLIRATIDSQEPYEVNW